MQGIVYQPAFFTQPTWRFKSGLRFFALTLLLFISVQVLFSLPGTIHFLRTIFSEQWDAQRVIVQNIFPEELVITVTNGAVSTNATEPVALPIPLEWRSSRADMPENLVVIDTTKPIETSDFAEEDTAFIMSEHSFGYHDFEQGEFRIYDTRDRDWKESFSVNKAGYDVFITQTFRYLRGAIVIGITVLPFVVYGALFVGFLLYLLFGALVVWLAAKIKNYPIKYGQAYIAAFYLLPVPFFYQLLLSIMPGMSHGIPFGFSFVLFVMALINFPKITPNIPEPASKISLEA